MKHSWKSMRESFLVLLFTRCYVSLPAARYLVPADGVKGKTWGPSTVHQKERAHIRPVVTDGERQWSRSAPNLEKSQKAALAAAAHSHLPPIPTSSTLPDFGQHFLSRRSLFYSFD